MHNDVARTLLTEELGDPVTLNAGEQKVVMFRIPVPDNVLEQDNLHVVLYTTYEGTYEGSAIGIVSYVDWGYVVDNVVNIPVGSTVEFGYED